MKLVQALAFTFLLVATGCQSPSYTSFAPLDARLEPIPTKNSRYLVVINSSGMMLHNLTFSSYLWTDEGRHRQHGERMLGRGMGSLAELPPGQAIRFHEHGKSIELAMAHPVSKVEVFGHCDEGNFRQAWVKTESGELRRVAPSAFAQR